MTGMLTAAGNSGSSFSLSLLSAMGPAGAGGCGGVWKMVVVPGAAHAGRAQGSGALGKQGALGAAAHVCC